MKDDSGSYAVLTEQGSSASQLTTAKIMVGELWFLTTGPMVGIPMIFAELPE